MLGPLTNLTDDQLLNYTATILSRPGELSAFDLTELEQLNFELLRREGIRRCIDRWLCVLSQQD